MGHSALWRRGLSAPHCGGVLRKSSLDQQMWGHFGGERPQAVVFHLT